MADNDIMLTIIIVLLLFLNVNCNDDATTWGGWNVADNKVLLLLLLK